MQVTACLNLPCFCVGTHNSESSARSSAFSDVRDAAGDGVALAQLIQRRSRHQQPSILHIAGHDIASAAAHDRIAAGRVFHHAAWPVYAAEPATALSDPRFDALKDGKLHAVLVFSPRTAEALKALLAQHALEACCADLIAIGISEAAAGEL